MVRTMQMAGGRVSLNFLAQFGELTWHIGINAKGKKGIFPSNYVSLGIRLYGHSLMPSCLGGAGLRLAATSSISNCVESVLWPRPPSIRSLRGEMF